jgi:hypothetical protein
MLAHRHRITRHYKARLLASPPAFGAVEPSLRYPYISAALTPLPLGLAAYRTPARLWLIGLQRKLRLPLLPAPYRCPCGGVIDIYGDHLFSCPRFSKINLHNRVRDSWYLMLSHIAPLAQLASTSADITCEPCGLVPQFHTIRPADVAIRLPPP